MYVFYLLLITPLLLQHVGVRGIDYEKKNKIALTVFFVMMTALVALRHENVGIDTQNYIYFFRRYAAMSWGSVAGESQEIGFVFYCKLISLVTKDPHVFFGITAFITSAMMYPTYRRLCKDATLTVALYCSMSTFIMMFSGIRQMLAISIGFIAYEFCRNKKLIPFIITVAVAILIHDSAFVLLAIYPLYRAKITKKWLYIVVPVLVIVFVFNQRIFSLLSVILNEFTRFDATMTSTGAYYMLILFVLFAVFAFLIPDEKKLDKETIAMRNLLLLSIVIQMFAPLHYLAMRINYYFIIFIPLLLPRVVAAADERWKQIAVISRNIIIVFLIFYFFYSAYTKEMLEVFPYKFFWE